MTWSGMDYASGSAAGQDVTDGTALGCVRRGARLRSEMVLSARKENTEEEVVTLRMVV